MRIEKRLNLRLAAEDINILESEEDLETSIQSGPERDTYRSIIDAIKRFFSMDARDLYQFATEGGSIEEGLVVIESLTPQTILEQQVHRTVQTGNYFKVLEVRMPGEGLTYKGFIVVKLNQPNERIEKALQARMAGWKPGTPVPFEWFKTEAEALKDMSERETKAAGKSPTPARPIKQKVTKAPVNQIAAKMAQKMGAQEAADEIVNMSSENIIKYADLGMKTKPADNWGMVKTVFLTYLSLAALVTGGAGLAALVLGYLAVKGYEAYRKGQIKEDLDDKDTFSNDSLCYFHNCHQRPDSEAFHAAHGEVDTEIRKRYYGHQSHHSGGRPWGVDPQEWQRLWDETMAKHGYTLDMSGDKPIWVRSSPE